MLIEHLSTPLPDSEEPTSAQDPGQGAGALRWLEQQTLQKCKGRPPQVSGGHGGSWREGRSIIQPLLVGPR